MPRAMLWEAGEWLTIDAKTRSAKDAGAAPWKE